ncbi:MULTISPECIES: alpha/beta fold hydrolase [Pseudomonas]|uniref:alpha/beta fold hydrolase n=1 Tax=Pseudomonas TaxID=286 RepID=UPI000C9B5E8A|nr:MULTISPECIES: alpha/beta hydrolase [Pseudomonas]MDH0131668.1 alpha/beta hydrolase [Pseudomonas asiatica]PNG87619.1 3-oxoadipate enol-lactonase 2 [Pseudomonas putida]QNV67877.1 alpha/beta hydrolase [Pseudomonas sp. CFA]
MDASVAVQAGMRLVGSGARKVIVVHGWMAGSALFEPLHEHLDIERFTYAFMDCRGYGERQQAPGPYSVEQIAEDMLALADALEWPVFSVLGHSMAGMAAQWLMVSVPQRLERVVLLATVPASGAVLSTERRTLLGEAMHDPNARRALISANVGRRRPRSWLDTLLALSLDTASPQAMQAYLESWAGDGFAERMQGVSVPTLVLVGEHDPGSTVAGMNATVMAWLTDARLTVLEDVGHYPMCEAPAMLARAIEAWILPGSKPQVA